MPDHGDRPSTAGPRARDRFARAAHITRDVAREVATLARLALRRGAALCGGAATRGALCIVTDPAGAVLLVHPRYRARWGLPGGYLEPGEEPSVGMARELREETGLHTSPDVLVALAQRRRVAHVDHLYRLVVDVPAPKLRGTSWEIGAVRWAMPDDVGRIGVSARWALTLLR